MAHRFEADNQGNRWRKVIARNEGLALLVNDLRVQEHLQLWVRVQDQRAREEPPAWMQALTVDQAIAACLEADIDALAAVLQAMGVPWRWCADALVRVSFPVMRHNAAYPHDRRAVTVAFQSVGARAGSRVPRHGGQDVKQWVRWWYRRKIKQPPDELHELVAEYATRENRVTEAHSVVRNGIEWAELLLNAELRP